MCTSSLGTLAKTPSSVQGRVSVPLGSRPSTRHRLQAATGMAEQGPCAWEVSGTAIGGVENKRSFHWVWKCSIYTWLRSILLGSLLLTQLSQFSLHWNFMGGKLEQSSICNRRVFAACKRHQQPDKLTTLYPNTDRNERFSELNSK